MRTKRLGIATAASFLLLAGVAVADKKIELTGSVKGDDMAQVELKVIKTKGEVEAVKGIKFKDLLIQCEGGDERVKLRPRGKVSVNEAGRFSRTYEGDNGGELMLRGGVKNNGKKAQGHIESGKAIDFNGKDCEVPDTKFKVSK